MCGVERKSLRGGLEPPTFRLTAGRAKQLRRGQHVISSAEYIFNMQLK